MTLGCSLNDRTGPATGKGTFRGITAPMVTVNIRARLPTSRLQNVRSVPDSCDVKRGLSLSKAAHRSLRRVFLLRRYAVKGPASQLQLRKLPREVLRRRLDR